MCVYYNLVAYSYLHLMNIMKPVSVALWWLFASLYVATRWKSVILYNRICSLPCVRDVFYLCRSNKLFEIVCEYFSIKMRGVGTVKLDLHK